MYLRGERTPNTIPTRRGAEPTSVRGDGGPFCIIVSAVKGADKYEQKTKVVSCAVSLNIPTATKSTGPRQSNTSSLRMGTCVVCLLPAHSLALSPNI